MDIKVKEHLTSKEIEDKAFQTIKTVAYEYITGRKLSKNNKTYYFGKLAVENLYKTLISFSQEPKFDNITQVFSECLHQTKISRYFFRDLLKDISNNFGGNYIELYNDFSQITNQWDKFYLMFTVNMKRKQLNQKNFNSLIDYLKILKEKELKSYKKALDLSSKYNLLEKMS
ncbi:hypothetical protein [Halonatronum saccharophilum]|uniref:hypothetical protein n=1 Tax=Halonatronum saccharophilum TaxID=150060 RepID=UPI000487785F|nr:hypothetical protein [Halonatronum saccharophilum]